MFAKFRKFTQYNAAIGTNMKNMIELGTLSECNRRYRNEPVRPQMPVPELNGAMYSDGNRFKYP